MTKQNAKELALQMRQRGFVATPPVIVDEVLDAHIRSRRQKQEVVRPRKSGRREPKTLAPTK